MERLIELFQSIIDVRDSKGKRHCLTHILILSVCAILNGYNDFEDIRDYGKAHEEWFDSKLNLWRGIPSARTINNVFRLIPAQEFLNIFLIWINEIIGEKTGKQIIIDGKGIRAAAEKSKNGNTPYIVSGYIADLGISIGQVKVEEKSNEITAIPKLLDLLNIEGCIITIDAMGTQTKIMDKIIKNKADFVLPLKENQKGAYQEVKDYYEEAITDYELKAILSNPQFVFTEKYTNTSTEDFEIYVERETNHGRKTERIYIQSKNISWLKNDKFKHIESIIMVISNTTVHDNSIRYYVSSKELSVEEMSKIIRKHWQIENNLHWVLDMYFYEDLSRTSKDNALENLSLMRKLCYNIIKLDTRYDIPNKKKLSIKRKINRYNLYPNEFEELLFQVIPQIYLQNN